MYTVIVYTNAAELLIQRVVVGFLDDESAHQWAAYGVPAGAEFAIVETEEAPD